jgi:hypothetical protein
LENRTERGFPQRPHPSSYWYEEDRRPKRTTLINLSTDSDQVQSPPRLTNAVPRSSAVTPGVILRMLLERECGLEPRSTLFQTAQRKRRIRQRGCYVPTVGCNLADSARLCRSPDESGVAATSVLQSSVQRSMRYGNVVCVSGQTVMP